MNGQKKIFFLILIFWITGIVHLNAAAPNWQVNPTDYQYNMTGVFRVLKNNTNYLNEAGSKIGIFVGSQIRGVVNGSDIIFIGNNAYFPATMYSNTQIGDLLSFKIYVPSFDSIFVASETAIFNRLQSLGTPANPFVLHIATCVDILTLTTANSPLSGTYRAIQEIRLQGNIMIASGSFVTLDAPAIRSLGQFTPQTNAQILIKAGGCL